MMPGTRAHVAHAWTARPAGTPEEKIFTALIVILNHFNFKDPRFDMRHLFNGICISWTPIYIVKDVYKWNQFGSICTLSELQSCKGPFGG